MPLYLHQGVIYMIEFPADYRLIGEFAKQMPAEPFGKGVTRYSHKNGVIYHLDPFGVSHVFTTTHMNTAYGASMLQPPRQPSYIPCELITEKQKLAFKYSRSDLIITEFTGNIGRTANPDKTLKLVKRFHNRVVIPDAAHTLTVVADTLICLTALASAVYVVFEPYGDAIVETWKRVEHIPDRQPIKDTDFMPAPGFVDIQKTYGRAPKRK